MSVAVKGNRESTQTQHLPTEKETVQGTPNFMGIRHIGLPAKDPAALAVFYRDVMGMKVMRQTPTDYHYGATAFLARHPEEEDHDVVFEPCASAHGVQSSVTGRFARILPEDEGAASAYQIFPQPCHRVFVLLRGPGGAPD
jgi:catechol 2,3-dioxygenase-like lactoylglutathione lyase family enzyme